jgi:dsRNA-specific ribonuclease
VSNFDRINHILADMSAQVSAVYSAQMSQFEASIVAMESILAKQTNRSDLHQNQCDHFLKRLSDILDRRLPAAIAIAIKHASVPDLSKSCSELSDFYQTRLDNPRGSGQQAAYLAINHYLFKRGFFENKSREHASYICNYLFRSELIANAWIRFDLGLLCTTWHYNFSEKDIVTAFYTTITLLVKHDIPFEYIEQFVVSMLDPLSLLRNYEYDIFVTRDPKTCLQEYMQGFFSKSPSYETWPEDGRPAHDPLFHSQVTVPGLGVVRQSGRSKHEATVLAAESALEALRKAKSPQFLKFEAVKVEAAYGKVKCISQVWRPRYSQVVGARKWITEIDFPFRLTDPKIVLNFSTASSQLRNGGCAHCNGVQSQIGSSIIGMVFHGCDSTVRPEHKARLVYQYLRQHFKIELGESLIFGVSPEHGERFVDDILQSVVFSAFQHFRDELIKWLRHLINEGLDSAANEWKDTESHGLSRLLLHLDYFDETVVYTTLLQEFTQSRSSRAKPEYSVSYDTMRPHAPNHQCRCGYEGVVSSGSGSSVKRAKNRAAFEMLKLIRDRLGMTPTKRCSGVGLSLVAWLLVVYWSRSARTLIL